ncbi:transposase [Brevundimonas sp. SORGH_AS 993]|nr:transposase [Brevundimonas sp. SORGH_AS_0993]
MAAESRERRDEAGLSDTSARAFFSVNLLAAISSNLSRTFSGGCYILADKAYDGDRLYKKIIDQGGDPVVPPRRHRKRQHTYEADLYKERNRVERFFSHIKHFRRVATRYDKLASNFKGFTTLASIMLWLK